MEFVKKLVLDDPEVERGIREGLFDVIGGLVKDKKNSIMKHLVEVPGEGAVDLANVLPPLAKVTAVASVLNLGVSVAGFAYMGYKLNQVQRAIQGLRASLSHIEGSLASLSSELHVLRLLAESNQTAMNDLQKAVNELHRLILMREFIELSADIVHRGRFLETPYAESIKVASRARQTFADQVSRLAPALDGQTLLLWEVSVRGWAVATATEVQLLLECGRASEAVSLGIEEANTFRSCGQNWAKVLLSDEKHQALQTAYRFTAPRLRNMIAAEQVDRVARLSPMDRDRGEGEVRRAKGDVEVEFSLAWVSALSPAWDADQKLRAELLDGMSDLAERLEARVAFAKLCQQTGKRPSDIFPSSTLPGVYVLEMVDGSASR